MGIARHRNDGKHREIDSLADGFQQVVSGECLRHVIAV
jgi:hypothetical protein